MKNLVLLVLMAGVAWVGSGTVRGQPVRQYDVQSQGIFGVSLAIDCDGNMYFTNNATKTLNIWHNPPSGEITTVLTIDSANNPVAIDEISWDASRGVLWGACCWPSIGKGIGIYTIETSGLCEFLFHVWDPGWPFGGADGLAFDPDTTWPGGSLWLSWDQNDYALHYTTTGTFLSRIDLPMEGSNPSNISGICSTPHGLWCARYGMDYHCITLHSKSGGPPIQGYTIDTSPLYQPEGLECQHNPSGFPDGTCLLWVKDIRVPQTISAYRIPSGSCECPTDSAR